MGTLFGSLTLLALILILLAAVVLAFEVWMFVSALQNPRLNDSQRLIWCIGMVLVHPFVAIAYYFMEHTKGNEL